MVTIDDYIKNLEKLISLIPDEVNNIIEFNKQEILDLNREKQLFDLGINSDGSRITPFYTNSTVNYKRKVFMPYNRVTLYDTGSFYKEFDFIKAKNKITIFSRDSKTSDLQDKYGSKIFGLTKEHQLELNYEIIKPELLKFINKYI